MERPRPLTEEELREEFADCIAQAARNFGVELDHKVRAVFGKVDRRNFIPATHHDRRMQDRVIPLGGTYESTISQPSLMAIMLQLAQFTGPERALEIGTASGLNAAYMSHLVQEVHTIEYNETLVALARANLVREGRENVTVHQGDGLKGLREHGPFDRIIVTAGASTFPMPLIDQLAPNGRMIIPVGKHPFSQNLFTIVNDVEKQELMALDHGIVHFVPLISQEPGGWTQEVVDECKKDLEGAEEDAI